MDLTSTSLGFKEAASCKNHDNAFKNFGISRLHPGMCKKSKLRAYRELKEDSECKKYSHGVSGGEGDMVVVLGLLLLFHSH